MSLIWCGARRSISSRVMNEERDAPLVRMRSANPAILPRYRSSRVLTNTSANRTGSTSISIDMVIVSPAATSSATDRGPNPSRVARTR